MTNSIIVLLGACATGKDTTLTLLKEMYPKLQTCISHTTRPPRATEVNGREYYFIDEAEFEAMYSNGEFIETRSYTVIAQEENEEELKHEKKIWHYGMTEKELSSKLEKGHVVMILDLQGLIELRDYYSTLGVDVHAFYLSVDVDTRVQRYLKRDNITYAMVLEMMRRFSSDEIDFYGVDNYATFINNPKSSEMSAYTISNYLINRGVKL